MTFTDIHLERDGAIGHLVLARPARNNAVNHDMLAQVCRGLDDLIADDAVKAIILRADGKHFCVGADFDYLGGLTRVPPLDIEQQIYVHFQGAAKRLYHCPKPTVAAINGAAVTVGCELALACDFRIMAHGASLRESWIRLGLMPPLGGLFLLPRMIGLARASQMVLRGEAITAERAVSWGLALAMTNQEDLVERAVDLAGELAALPAIAYATIKQALHRGLETTMDAEWATNVSKQALLLGSDDFAEAIAALQAAQRDRAEPA